jgi:hypothetical protein
MKERTQDLLFGACGIASAVLVHLGLFVGLASGQAFVNLGSSPTKVAHELAKPAGTGVWVGAYLGLLGFGVFLAFAVWATARLGGGVLGAIARSAAAAYASVSIAALCVFDAVEFRAGHGMGTQLATALTNINEALYVGSWFLTAFFLLPAGALALQSGRRALGWGAIAIALLSLAAAAAPANSLAENAVLLWFIWIIWASISLARGEREPAGAVSYRLSRPSAEKVNASS